MHPIPEHALLSNAEIEAVLLVLWHTSAIRSFYEDRALSEENAWWRRNAGVFPNLFRGSKSWNKLMGPEDETVRGGFRISKSLLDNERRDFKREYWDSIIFALELVYRIREAVAKEIEKNDARKVSDMDDWLDKAGSRAWKKIASDPSVWEGLAKVVHRGVDEWFLPR
jgi:hypothetical protein